ncbi:adhesion G protein-coupled receptor E2-like [Dendronephthya gigantea]|uniref:adhesion G protein-coupled receptor E2-like n=2 Tax=Dendronephthya gigantea TaxID=151771 RepID=UPI00106DD09D|nr:adhesion G protein-coupled receptor E2-like [Dendronephthya gigantea]
MANLWFCILLSSILLKGTHSEMGALICYNSTLEGTRLKYSVIKSKFVQGEMIDCLMECVTEPCCRSINYKNNWMFENETNCEMLHNMVYTASKKMLEKNSSYDHAYLINPAKVFNKSCMPEIDECALGTHKCHSNAICNNTIGSYECHCRRGFAGNGKICSVHELDSHILSAESPEFTRLLGEWLPETGNWSVCWRITRDGNKSATFQQKCKSKVPTLTVVKVLKDNKSFIFGGYAAASWTGNMGGVNAPGSFLFSFRNNGDLPPFKSHCKEAKCKDAVLRNPESGPKFGTGPDFSISDGSLFQPKGGEGNAAIFGVSYKPPSGYADNTRETQSLLTGSYIYFTPSEVEVLYLN